MIRKVKFLTIIPTIAFLLLLCPADLSLGASIQASKRLYKQSVLVDDCGDGILRGLCPRFGTLTIASGMARTLEAKLGAFTLQWRGRPRTSAQLVIQHAFYPDEPVWATSPGKTFVAAGKGKETVHEVRGSIRINDHMQHYCRDQSVESWSIDDDAIELSGSMGGRGCSGRWRLRFVSIDDERLRIQLSVTQADGDVEYNRSFLTYHSHQAEHIYGFGMQYSRFDMKGRLVPILCQEQGVGRGLQPFSTAVNLTQGRGVAGDWWTSYGAVPQYMTSDRHSLVLEESEFAQFDLRHDDNIRIGVFANHMNLQLFAAKSPSELLEVYTRYAGRMKPLPSWVGEGAIIGIQGGLPRVRRIYQRLIQAGVPISALWIQDWVGKRKTSFGSQLWWNWELDQDSYADLAVFAAELRMHGVRLLTYVNPFLTDPSTKGGVRRNLFAEASASGFLVKDHAAAPYMIQNTSFAAGLLDISNPLARIWFKGVIADQVLSVGASGWMADFGEALPMDAQLAGAEAKTYHNQYPEEWARLNREVLEERGTWDDSLVFSRSAFTKSPGIARLFWLGDQMVSWDGYDGMRTALTGLLTSGLSGFSLNHSDTGGYTTVNSPVLRFQRSSELMSRWTEMNAFTAVLRTHEGNFPEANAQVYDDDTSIEHLSRFARVYIALASYRLALMNEALNLGLPLVRPLWLHYPEDPETAGLATEFLLGKDVLVAPVFEQGAQEVKVYLPDDGWEHLPTGRKFKRGWYQIAAPIGQPAAFYRNHLQNGTADPLWVHGLRGLLKF